MSVAEPKHRGWSGGFSYAAVMFAILIVVSAAGGVAIYLVAREPDPAWHLFRRLLLFSGITSLTAGLCRGLSGATWDRFLTLKMSKGDGGVVGAVVGLVLAGWQTPTPVAPAYLVAMVRPPDGGNVMARIVDPLLKGVIVTDWWILAAYIIVGALIACGIEALIRRAMYGGSKGL